MVRAQFIVLVLAAFHPALAVPPSVDAQLSANETFVGAPVTLQITINDATTHDPPVMPSISGATVQFAGGPNQSSQVTIANGRMEKRMTLTYDYQITPQAVGQVVIPAFKVVADGREFTIPARTLIVSKSETNDVLFVELKASKPAVYLGESLEVTLQIWLRPFRDAATAYQLDENRMWSCVDHQASNWGDFADVLRTRNGVTVRRANRADAQGNDRAYFVYELPKTLWPERVGQYSPGPINIIVQYPTRIGRSEDPFSVFQGNRLSVVDRRPIAAQVKVDPIKIKPIPTDGMSPFFRGAVGRFQINAQARPVEVTVGDPITLTLNISGNGRLDLLQPPPLTELPELARDFKIPTDPLAGVVEGVQKKFTQSIRAISDTVTQIPPIPFAYFDPAAEKFVTVNTSPIPLRVKAAEKLSLSQVVDAGGGKTGPTLLTVRTGGILANYLDADDLLSQGELSFGWPAAAAVVVPPVLCAVCWFTNRRTLRLRTDVAFARRRGAAKKARRAIDAAANGSNGPAAAVEAAVREYVADRLNLPGAGLTPAEITDALAQRGAAAPIVDRVRVLLERCELSQYASAAGDGAGVAAEATALIDELERERLA